MPNQAATPESLSSTRRARLLIVFFTIGSDWAKWIIHSIWSVSFRPDDRITDNVPSFIQKAQLKFETSVLPMYHHLVGQRCNLRCGTKMIRERNRQSQYASVTVVGTLMNR